MVSAEAERTVVLVVDDEAGLRTLCRHTLEPHYQVIEAEHGREALRRFFEERPSLVLLDLSMPVMDGWETRRRLRDLADVPIIMLTGRAAGQDAAVGLDMGADDYVTKPFSPVELCARIRAVLRRRGGPPVQE